MVMIEFNQPNVPKNLPHNCMSSASFQSLSNFIWSVADLLRGPYRPSMNG